jgi:hypothetical protein
MKIQCTSLVLDLNTQYLSGGGGSNLPAPQLKGPQNLKNGGHKRCNKKILDLNFTGIGLKKCVLPMFLQVFEPFYFRNVRENFFYSCPLANILGKYRGNELKLICPGPLNFSGRPCKHVMKVYSAD